MEEKTTLRKAMMAIIAELENGVSVGGAYEFVVDNMSDFDAKILHDITERCGGCRGTLVDMLTKYIEQSTTWVVTRQVGNDSIRACFPCDLKSATECLRRHILRGNIATLSGE